MKIDVEGAEDRVILGAKQVIETYKPIILIELRKGELYQKVRSVLTDGLYEVCYLNNDWFDQSSVLADLLFIPRQ